MARIILVTETIRNAGKDGKDFHFGTVAVSKWNRFEGAPDVPPALRKEENRTSAAEAARSSLAFCRG
jgi:hypothetical protein